MADWVVIELNLVKPLRIEDRLNTEVAIGTGGAGGTGGGGAGGNGGNNAGTNGTANTGGGGGGAGSTTSSGNSNVTAGIGGSGVVIIRYPSSYKPATTTGSPTFNTSGGYHIYTFNGDGSITF